MQINQTQRKKYHKTNNNFCFKIQQINLIDKK